MRADRFPRRGEALLRLCATEPALCGDTGRARRRTDCWALALLLLALGLFLLPARAQSLRRQRGVAKAAAVTSVESVGMTVSDMDASVEFYTRVLTFEKVSDVEVCGRRVRAAYKASSASGCASSACGSATRRSS